jgi:uncharacterized repeat protein (TIGR03803 family)
MTRLRIYVVALVFLFFAVTVIAAPAQSTFFTTLASFNGMDGDYPYAGLVQASDGNFYGTTGGFYGVGTVFKITPEGTLTSLHSFDGTDGEYPFAALVQASDGNFYGTTGWGGAYGYGTVFKITSTGTLTTLHSFDSSDGANPWAGLLQASDGNFYGTTYGGGATGQGTVFKITPAGMLTTLYSFCSQNGCADGSNPQAGLVQGADGNFYGTTYFGAINNCSFGCGTVFKITPAGTLTTLHSFDNSDGASPKAALVQASDGNFYGTTPWGGPNGGGTIFKITPTGVLTTLYSFGDMDNPESALVQASDGNFYGTAIGGGTRGSGAVFEITPSGTLRTLYSFCSQPNCADGDWPQAGLVQARDGTFYGTTFEGGAYGYGTVYRIGLVHTCAMCRP